MRLGGTQRHAAPRGLLRLPNVDRGLVVVNLQVTRIDIYALALQAWLFVHVAKTDAKLETGVEEVCNPVMESCSRRLWWCNWPHALERMHDPYYSAKNTLNQQIVQTPHAYPFLLPA